ncbi:ECF transporter S component [Anaerobium acetethylicum]|uniref:Energy-coupling factor transport system substrate-specific component n=1 Tax=Anaerobium acetethylicum TaxID=1619234 RepID=A0A1D3TRM6_9FIRM|nr:ECF transporter S component [Anaerobium acetethylicum]SCP96405.1 energy-coupling factor transport system substrate-specific component [Anaerobium acetethylicum]
MKLKDILFVAITAVLFGIVYLGAVYMGAALTGILTPMGLGIYGYEPFYGIWFLAAVFTTYVLQKPGVGIIAEMLAALLEVLMGNFFGPIIFISGFIQGLGSEIGFAVFRYKKYSLQSTMLAATGCTVLSFIWTGIRSQYWTLSPMVVLGIFVIRLASALIICGFGCKLLADGLAKAGVLKGYALGLGQMTLEEE